MTPIKFPQANANLAKDQPQYEPLPVFIDRSGDEIPMTCCFQLTPEEIEQVTKTGKFWMTQLTFGHPFQPIRLSALSPFENTNTN